jgi:hypothetical protein
MESTPAHLINIDQALIENAANVGPWKCRLADRKPAVLRPEGLQAQACVGESHPVFTPSAEES